MESPVSTVRRRAWINSCRQRLTDPLLYSLQSTTIADDDVFSDSQVDSPGCCSGKIENWFLTCRSMSSENAGQLSFESTLKACGITDELNHGADADTNNTLDIGVAEILQVYSEKAEETLYELGFGSEEPQVTVRIPPRFFTFPSQAKGINFRMFLDAQLQRIREEDPSLSLASRFRQVQVLTAMANVFYSLYSHVSRTPVRKLPTPEFNFSTPIERMERFRSSIRSDPRSPVDKFKDTVSRMCLYSGSNRDSDSPLPSPNKRVDIVLEKPRHKKTLDLGKDKENALLDDQDWETMDHIAFTTGEGAKQNGSTKNDLVCSDQAASCQTQDFCVETTYHPSLLSEALEPGSVVWEANSKSRGTASYEHICPQIVERIHQAPFY